MDPVGGCGPRRTAIEEDYNGLERTVSTSPRGASQHGNRGAGRRPLRQDVSAGVYALALLSSSAKATASSKDIARPFAHAADQRAVSKAALVAARPRSHSTVAEGEITRANLINMLISIRTTLENNVT